MFTSIRTRFWLTYAIVIGVVLTIIFSAIVIYLARNPFEIRQNIQRLKIINAMILQRGTIPLNQNSFQLEKAISRVDESFDVRIIVLDPDGQVLADSRATTDGIFLNVQKPVNLAIASKNNTIMDSNGKLWLFNTRANQDGYRIVVAIPRPRAQILSLFRDELLLPFLQAGIIALVLSLILSYWIAKWISLPLQRIGKAAQWLANGKYEKIIPEGPSEVRELATVFNDMSDRVQSSQQSQRDLVANVSHELKTPLTSIQGFAQAMLDGTMDSSDEFKRAAGIIFSESNRMNRMVLELLELAKLDSGLADFHLNQIEIGSLLSESIEKFRSLADRNSIRLHLIKNESIQLQCDPDRITQVISNLLDNAIKLSPPNGLIEVAVEKIDQSVEIRISDQGPGIPHADLDRIFERFYQIDKARSSEQSRGVGLGLSIAREIVNKHRGSIWVENNSDSNISGLGCSFFVRLPLA